MKIPMKPFASSLFLAGLMTLPGGIFAAELDAKENSQIEKLSKQTKMLLAQVGDLQQQVNTLKNKKTIYQATAPKKKKILLASAKKQSVASGTQPTSDDNDLLANSSSDSDETIRKSPTTNSDLSQMIAEERQYLPFDLDVPGQAFVSTGPYIGVPIVYSGSNLVINSPSVNTDLQLLDIRRSIHEQLVSMGGELYKEPYHSHLLLSGVVEAQAGYTNFGGKPSTSSIDVTNVSFDAFFIGPSDWLLGFIEFSYDNGPTSTSQYVVSNSRVYVNKAFITIGDLSKSPFYGTAGQIYVPFGTYSSLMISDPLTKIIGRTKARALELGFQQSGDNAFYGSTYIFRGDSHVGSVSRINNGGLNLGYKYKGNPFRANVGAGVIANIADSGGMQNGNGFSQYERISHRVPAYDLRGIFGLGDHIDVITEFVTASTNFSANDMSFDGRGAKPWAFDVEAGYSFYILDSRPSTLGLGYTQSHEALSLGIPQSRYSLVFNTSLWRNTLQAIELRHDKNYSSGSTANGPVGAATTPGECTAAACTSTGRSDNGVTISFDYYF